MAPAVLPSTGAEVHQKCFIGRMMSVRRRNVDGRSENPQRNTRTCLLRTDQNMCFLAKGSELTAVVISHGVDGNILMVSLRMNLPSFRSFNSIIASSE